MMRLELTRKICALAFLLAVFFTSAITPSALNVTGAQPFVDTGNFVCVVDSGLNAASYTLPTGSSLSSSMFGFFEANIDEAAGTSELFDLHMYSEAIDGGSGTTGLIFYELDFRTTASGTLTPDSSGRGDLVDFDFNLNLTLTTDSAGQPFSIPANLSGVLLTGSSGFEGSVTAALPSQMPFVGGAQLALVISCQPSRIDEAEDEFAGTSDPLLEGGFDETFVLPSDEEFLENVRRQEPDLELFEFVGMVDILTEDQYQSDIAAQQELLSKMTRSEIDRLMAIDDQENSGRDALIVMVSADGRMYRERPGVRARRDLTGTGPDRALSAQRSALRDESAERVPDVAELSPRAIKGSDGRKLTTTSAYHGRAVGVILRDFAGSVESFCSAGMVSHRIVMTAAHCVSTNGNNLKIRVAAPAGRGTGFNGNKAPFGDRRIEWYSWPSNFNGSLAYPSRDYAALVLEDIPWSPGYIYFRTKSLSYLDWNTHLKHGAPANFHPCADSPLNDGTCGGYRYGQKEVISVVFGKYFYHYFDTHTGQSGSNIWENDNGNRYVHGIHIIQSACCWNIAHRFHSDSIDHFCWWVENRPSSHFGGNPQCN